MRPAGTEPGDFVELDIDMIEADRRQQLRFELERVRKSLESEIETTLQVNNDGNDLVLCDDEGVVRYRPTMNRDGRLIVTNEQTSAFL
jgi:hypothetical protein